MPVQNSSETAADLKLRIEQNALLERGLLYADQYINRQYIGLSC